jgi:hypothetical protein
LKEFHPGCPKTCWGGGSEQEGSICRLVSIMFWNLLRNCRYILGDFGLRTAWMFAQLLCQLVEIIYTHCWSWWSQWVSHGSVLICRSSMERRTLYGMMQQGAVASWVLLSQVLHILQK